MYEQHFGLSAPPFQLNPDPGFYFDSKGHANALAYLRYGAYQGEGFIVVTGEIGAGKTTLVRALLATLDPAKVVAAQLVSTQLEAGDLLRSILVAFGVPSDAQSKAQLIASLEAYLTALAVKGRRALLVVDEAQNLNHEAVEELRMLSNFQFARQALLQSFLVGQPELRRLLQSRSMEQLRQRVLASCHLGPLDAPELRAYIEHRLRHVGWSGRPAFQAEAFAAIHQATAGIPRRINVLCNRLLLACYLTEVDEVSAVLVQRVAADLGAEVGQPAPLEDAPPASTSTAPAAAAPAPVRLQGAAGSSPRGGLGVLVETSLDYLKARTLVDALSQQQPSVPVLLINPMAQEQAHGEAGAASRLAQAALELHLQLPQSDNGAVPLAASLAAVQPLLAEHQLRGMAVLGHGDGALAAALAAAKAGLPVFNLDGGQRGLDGGTGVELNGMLIDHMADTVFTRRITAHYALYKEGIGAERVQCLGSLARNVMHELVAQAPPAAEALRRLGASAAALGAYGLMVLPATATGQLPPEATALVDRLGRLPPLVWLVDEATHASVHASGQVAGLQRARVAVVPMLGLLETSALLHGAEFLLCSHHGMLVEQAEALGLPCVQLGASPGGLGRQPLAGGPVVALSAEQAVRAVQDAMAQRQADRESAQHWDGGPARGMARHIARRLARRPA